jgi:hypothetical protein
LARSAQFLRGGILACLVLTGCPGLTIPPGGPIPPGTPIGSTIDTATTLPLDAEGKAAITGNLTGNTVDVYDLGAVSPGDRIIISVRPAAGSGLDPTLAIFNAGGEAFAINDDAEPATGRVDSAIDDYVTQPSNRFYMAITKYFFSSVTGAYECSVEIRRGQSVPTPPPQILLLNFAGGTVAIPDEGTFTYGPFDAADIDASYAGQTAAIKTKIVDTVKQNFAGFGISIFSSDNPPTNTTGCVVSTIHFGAFSQTKFGIAQAVDDANRKRCDDAIVFTDDFDKPFANKPSVDGIAVAIGNVAAHEAGHLLGLNHVADVTDLMDTTGSASTLLADQEFKTSELSPTIFPFGTQNGPAMLQRVIPGP